MESSFGPVSTRSNDGTSRPVPLIPVMPDRGPINISDNLALPKFNGYSQKDARKFLAEFGSYVNFHGIGDDVQRKIAASHLHLQGPALVWFGQLSEATKTSWTAVEADCKQVYSNRSPLDPAMVMESALFNALRLSPSQPLEDFYSIILEKGRKLGKPERDLMDKFIGGLPPNLAVYVRVRGCLGFSDTLVTAQTVEAYGFRDKDFLPPSIGCGGTPYTDTACAMSVQSPASPPLESLTLEVQRLGSVVSQLLKDRTPRLPHVRESGTV